MATENIAPTNLTAITSVHGSSCVFCAFLLTTAI